MLFENLPCCLKFLVKRFGTRHNSGLKLRNLDTTGYNTVSVLHSLRILSDVSVQQTFNFI